MPLLIKWQSSVWLSSRISPQHSDSVSQADSKSFVVSDQELLPTNYILIAQNTWKQKQLSFAQSSRNSSKIQEGFTTLILW